MSAPDENAPGLDAYADEARKLTRAAQGLPEQVDDPAAVAQVTDAVAPWLEEQEKPRAGEAEGAA